MRLVPHVGLGPIIDRGDVVSGTATVLLELEIDRGATEWLAYGSVRGIGAACSDGCDLGGRTVGVGARRRLGAVGFGAGLGAMRQGGAWHVEPHVQVALGRGRLRGQFRVELPLDAYGALAPALVGVAIPLGAP